ncbi:MAG: DUF2855 family protein [Actinomycetota bacterium]
MRRIVIPRTDVGAAVIEDVESPPLDDGEVRLRIDRFGLSSNNITYALFGDALGYWAHFPVGDDRGCVPVWGFADVEESRHGDLAVGTRLFGFLPMATELVIRPDDIGTLALHDASPHRVALHPWYTRLLRCESDPGWSTDREPLQAAMWALFMTGWALADDIGRSASVVVSSASSKTALSLAWALGRVDEAPTRIGVTSSANRAFVESTGAYDAVITYDDVSSGGSLAGAEQPVAFVDAAGSPAITERIHAALGERLVESVVLGATHQGAGAATGGVAGPAPRFFFIPDVAEQRAAASSHADYHALFATAWSDFVPWIDEVLTVDEASGVDGVLATFTRAHSGAIGPETAKVLRW